MCRKRVIATLSVTKIMTDLAIFPFDTFACEPVTFFPIVEFTKFIEVEPVAPVLVTPVLVEPVAPVLVTPVLVGPVALHIKERIRKLSYRIRKPSYRMREWLDAHEGKKESISVIGRGFTHKKH